MADRTFYRIFKRGSTTYFHSALLFPPAIREDVFVLYGFVRMADDYVDSVPQQAEAFHAFVDTYHQAVGGAVTGNVVIDSFVGLAERRAFDPEWIDAFLYSMEQDLTVARYPTLDGLMGYLYGSAEVVGLMMAKILDLPEESHPQARCLGRAMQYINFIRDIKEDLELGRVYLPQEDLKRFGLSGLDPAEDDWSSERFCEFLHYQIQRYHAWQEMGEAGFFQIPRRYLISIKTASDMYRWTAGRISKNPLIVYAEKVKPSPLRIISCLMYNTLRPEMRDRTRVSGERTSGDGPW
jgi:15-cis-phytoene synthase